MGLADFGKDVYEPAVRKRHVYSPRKIKKAMHPHAKKPSPKKVNVHERYKGIKTRRVSLDALEKRAEVVLNFNEPNDFEKVYALCMEYNQREVYVQPSHSKSDMYHGVIDAVSGSYNIEKLDNSGIIVRFFSSDNYKDLAKLIVMRKP